VHALREALLFVRVGKRRRLANRPHQHGAGRGDAGEEHEHAARAADAADHHADEQGSAHDPRPLGPVREHVCRGQLRWGAHDAGQQRGLGRARRRERQGGEDRHSIHDQRRRSSEHRRSCRRHPGRLSHVAEGEHRTIRLALQPGREHGRHERARCQLQRREQRRDSGATTLVCVHENGDPFAALGRVEADEPQLDPPQARVTGAP
jgi:hypothetical protein